MVDICPGVMNESEVASRPYVARPSRTARRRRMEIQRLKVVARLAMMGRTAQERNSVKGRHKHQNNLRRWFAQDSHNAAERCCDVRLPVSGMNHGVDVSSESSSLAPGPSCLRVLEAELDPRYGAAAACGRRREMEDAVATNPPFCEHCKIRWHYFGVYDGHGCSHVATMCKERLHELVKEELDAKGESEWKETMERSFKRMDRETVVLGESFFEADCSCRFQVPDRDAVGSTAVVGVVTLEKIVVANCGDSRAVLCRGGMPVPLSSDHKPDHPEELKRIEAAGGRVIYWDGARVQGVLAMSRAIGDSYLKPYVSCEPDVTVTDRSPWDECLILASDGLWDVVSNKTACDLARMCLRGQKNRVQGLILEAESGEEEANVRPTGDGRPMDEACTDASLLLTKLALARHSTDNVSVVVVDLRRDA